jgi:hypothetical protein
MLKLEILNHWIVPQQGKNHSGFNEAPENQRKSPGWVWRKTSRKAKSRRPFFGNDAQLAESAHSVRVTPKNQLRDGSHLPSPAKPGAFEMLVAQSGSKPKKLTLRGFMFHLAATHFRCVLSLRVPCHLQPPKKN